MGNINRRNEMSLQGIMVVQIFYVWGIDFMGLFLPSFENLYILLAMDYVSKLVEAIACPKMMPIQWWGLFKEISLVDLEPLYHAPTPTWAKRRGAARHGTVTPLTKLSDIGGPISIYKFKYQNITCKTTTVLVSKMSCT